MPETKRIARVKALAHNLARWSGWMGIVGVILFAIAWFWFPFPIENFRQYDASKCITDRNGEILRATLSPQGQRCLPIPLADAGKWLPMAIVATEDKRFLRHHGVDFLALSRAIGQLAWNREVISGASTISTQLVRLAHPRPRTLPSKIIEAFRAFQMETILSKDEILEQYLNRAPFGSNLVGIRAASLHYFSKEPADLSLTEASLIAGLPQSPSRLRPDRHPQPAKKRRDHVLERMAECRFIEKDHSKASIQMPILLEPWTPPFLAPHFVDSILQGKLNLPSRTTLDLHFQKLTEDLITRHSSDKAQGTGVVILDAESGDILAMVGSPDYRNKRSAGQVNVTLAQRSPGSTLKPFAYALAMDRGLLTPEEILKDNPLNLPGYQPKNFDGNFRGAVSARQALIQSLNLPAIEILRRIGQKSFLETMQGLGLTTLNETREHYGLNLILGGGEVRLLDLARAYAKLAQAKPGDTISPEAAFLVAKILSGNERDLAVFGHARNERIPRVAWKTGTSARNRDAWTIAWDQQYIVGVWRGNPDGSPCPNLTGIQDAAPLALEIFTEISDHESKNIHLPQPPPGLAKRTICSQTGLPADATCLQTIMDWYLPGISKTSSCKGDCLSKANNPSPEHTSPHIIRPINGQTFAILSDRKNPSLALEAEGSGNLYWFVNGSFFRKSNAKEILQLPLEPGIYEITCTTDEGHADFVRIVVE